MSKITKLLAPAVLSREDSLEWTGIKMYAWFEQILSTSELSIYMSKARRVAGGFQTASTKFLLPHSETILGDYFGVEASHLVVGVEYSYTHLNPNDKMSRAEFLLELLGVWEGMKARLSPALKGPIGAELDLVMDYTKNAYQVTELYDIQKLVSLEDNRGLFNSRVD